MYIDSILELCVYLWLITSLSVTIYGIHIFTLLSIVLSSIIYILPNSLCSAYLTFICPSICLSFICPFILLLITYHLSIYLFIIIYCFILATLLLL